MHACWGEDPFTNENRMNALGKGCGWWGRDPNAEGILGASWRRWLEDQKDFPACGGRLRSGLEVRA